MNILRIKALHLVKLARVHEDGDNEVSRHDHHA